jgi:AsmA protein
MSQALRRQTSWKLWIIIGGVIGLVLVGLLVVPWLIDVNTYRDQIAAQLEERLGRPVTLGRLRLNVFPIVKFEAADVTIQDDPRFARNEFITAESVRVDVELRPLLRGDVKMRSIELTEPVVVLIRSKNEQWNWRTLKLAQSTEPSEKMPPLDIIIRDGRLTFIDQTVSPPTELALNGVNLELKGFSADSASPFTLALTLPGPTQSRVKADGTMGPINPSGFAGTPFNVHVEADELTLAGATAMMGQASQYEGRITLKADAERTPSGSLAITGTGTLSQARIPVEGLARPIEVTSAELRFDGGSLRLEDLRARLGSSQINGTVSVKDFANPVVNFDLKSDQVIVSEFQQPSPVPSVSAQTQRRGRSFPVRANGVLALGRLVHEKLTVTDVKSTVAVTDDVIDMNPLQFSLYGGQYNGRMKMAMGGGAPGVTLDGRFNDIDLNQFLLGVSSLKDTVYGRASGDLEIHSRGREFDDIVKSLNGQGVLTVSDGKITSFDLEKQVALLGNLTGLSTGGAGTVFRTLRTAVRFVDGQMRTDDLRLELGDLEVGGSGGLRLGDPVVGDYDLLARLSKELTQRAVPQGKIAQVAGTFFLDEQERLAVPLRMSGPLSNPHFSLNTAVLKANATNTIRRQAEQSLGDMLKGILGGKREPTKKEKP